MPVTQQERDEANEAWEGRADKAEGAYISFSRHPLRWIIGGAAALIVASLLFWIIGSATGLIGGYANKEKQILGVNHVAQVYAVAFQDMKSLDATANNTCPIEAEIAGVQQGSDAWLQLESQVNAFQENYNRIKADYDAQMANIFAAKQVKPRNLPFVAPTFKSKIAEFCGS